MKAQELENDQIFIDANTGKVFAKTSIKGLAKVIALLQIAAVDNFDVDLDYFMVLSATQGLEMLSN